MSKYASIFSSPNRTISASALNVKQSKTFSNSLNRFELERYFRISDQIGTYGLELYWKIYQAHRIESQEECSLFIFDKRQVAKIYKTKHRDLIIDVARQDILYLQTFNSPRILKIVYSIEETNDEMAFATEPLRGSLANMLNPSYHNKFKTSNQNQNYDLTDIERKLGIYQITESLRYLHTSQLYIHGNITPKSILITKNGDWRLAGLNFMDRIFPGQIDNIPKGSSWNPKIPNLCQPDLDYLAPECIGIGCSNSSSDMFSLGLLIISIFNDGQSLISANSNLQEYHIQVDKLHEFFNKVVDKIPKELIEPVEKMINKDIRYRPSSQLFSLLKYFNDKRILTLENLSTMDNKSFEEKRDLFLSLSLTIDQYEKPFLVNHLYPILYEKLMTCNVVYAEIVDSITSLIKQIDQTSYREKIRPTLIGHLKTINSAQQYIPWINHGKILISKSTEKEIQQEIIPLWVACLDFSILEAQICAIQNVSQYLPYLDEEYITDKFIGKIKSMISNKKSIKVQTVALEAVSNLLPNLSNLTITKMILPFFGNINLDNPELLKIILELYQDMLNIQNIFSAQSLATEVIQSLLPQTLNSQLNFDTGCSDCEKKTTPIESQFNLLFQVLHIMLDRISNERGQSFRERNQKNSSFYIPSTKVSEIRSSNGSQQPNSPESQKVYGNISSNMDVLPQTGNTTGTAPTPPEIMFFKRCQKTNSNPSIIIASGTGDNSIGYSYQQKNSELLSTHSLSIDESQQTLLVPQTSCRRHSYESMGSKPNKDANMITESICEGPFISPPSSKPASRRPSRTSPQTIINTSNNYLQQPTISKLSVNNNAQNATDGLTVVPVIRRSSFNSLSESVMNLFGS